MKNDYTPDNPIMAVLIAAAWQDRANLEAARVHEFEDCDEAVLRDRLENEAKGLSLALASLPPGLRVALSVRAGGGGLYEVISGTSGKVFAVTKDPLSVLAGFPDATFNRIRLARYLSYGAEPWTEPSPDYDAQIS
mgnify:CR=1 FL=1